MKRGIIYYTDNRLDGRLMAMCQRCIEVSGLPITSSSLKGIDFGDNRVMGGRRGYLTMFRQILDCLERSKADVVFFCEHDVVYHPSHFLFEPERMDIYYYNNHVWKWNGREAVSYDCRWLSQLCCSRELALAHYRKKIACELRGVKRRFEPGTRRGIDDYKTAWWESAGPNVDLRHGRNLTGVSRFDLGQFRSKPRNFVKREYLPYYGTIDLNTGA